jgi:hypothetical protein
MAYSSEPELLDDPLFLLVTVSRIAAGDAADRW